MMSLALALMCGGALIALLLWRVVGGGTAAESGPALRCTAADCDSPLGLERSFYQRKAGGSAYRRVKHWRCGSGHAWMSVEGTWCERFDRDSARDAQGLTEAEFGGVTA